METQPRVITIGEPLVALITDSSSPMRTERSYQAHIAGAELNVAIGLARLGVRTTYVGRKGNDPLGQMIENGLRAEGIDTTFLVTDELAPTGVLLRERRSIGPSEVLYFRRATAASKLDLSDVEPASASIREADLLHVTGITAAISDSARSALFGALEIAIENGTQVSFDLNHRRKLWSDATAGPVLTDIARRADIILASRDELALVRDIDPHAGIHDMLRQMSEYRASTLVLKHGLRGVEAVSQGGRAFVPSLATSAPDPVGAGDAFAAGFLAASLSQETLASALKWGAACGAACASVVGDTGGLPRLAELRAILEDPAQNSNR